MTFEPTGGVARLALTVHDIARVLVWDAGAQNATGIEDVP
jgi:hypothetical protein